MNLQTSQTLKGPQKCFKCKLTKDEYLSLICKHVLCMLCSLQHMQTVAKEAEIDGKVKEQTINQIKCPSCKTESYFNKDLTEKYRNINQMLAFDQTDLPEDNDVVNEVRQSQTIQNMSKKASNKQSLKGSLINNNTMQIQNQSQNQSQIQSQQVNMALNNGAMSASNARQPSSNLGMVRDESNMFSFTQNENPSLKDAQTIDNLMKQNEMLKNQLVQQQQALSQNESFIQPQNETVNQSMISNVQYLNNIATPNRADQSVLPGNHFTNTMDNSRLNHFRNNSNNKGSSKISKCAGCVNIETNNNEKYMLNLNNRWLLENPDLVENINQEMQRLNGYCNRHAQINELYCTLCKEMVCMNCHFLEKNNQKQHSGHTLIPIKNNEKDMITECKTIRKNQLSKQTSLTQQMDLQLVNIQKTVDNQADCEKQLNTCFLQLQQQLQNKQQDYLLQVQGHFEHTLRTQQQILLNLQTLHKISQQYTDYTSNIINQFNAVSDNPKVGMDFNNLAIFEKQSKMVLPVKAFERADMASIQIKDEKVLKSIGNLLVFNVKPFQRLTYENSTHTNVQTNYYDPLKSKVNQDHAINHQTNLSRSKTKNSQVSTIKTPNKSPLKTPNKSPLKKVTKPKSQPMHATLQKK